MPSSSNAAETTATVDTTAATVGKMLFKTADPATAVLEEVVPHADAAPTDELPDVDDNSDHTDDADAASSDAAEASDTEPTATPGRKKAMLVKVPKEPDSDTDEEEATTPEVATTPPRAPRPNGTYLDNVKSVLFAAPPGTTRNGLSRAAVTKLLKATPEENGRTYNAAHLKKALQTGVDEGSLIMVKMSYKLSPPAKQKFKKAEASSLRAQIAKAKKASSPK
jgi:hypothetical protein